MRTCTDERQRFMNKITRFLNLPWHDRLNRLHDVWIRIKTVSYYAHVFESVGSGSKIYKPILLANPKYVHIGNNVLIRPGARIEVIILNRQLPPSLLIGDNVNIEQNAHLICGKGVVIGNNVSIAPNCAILDTKHPFRDIEDPKKIGDRVEPGMSPIVIGDNSLIGFGSIILPNVHIGKNCVIGANSTVRGNVPDFCVAAGNPASVIMRYDFERRAWVRNACGPTL